MADTFWIDRIAAVKALILAYDAAILALASGAQTYQLDTSQTRQLVSKANLGSLRLVRDGLLNELATLEARVYGCGSTHIVPNY